MSLDFSTYADFSTSPSVYVAVVGTAAVEDQCGPLGSTLTNPIVALNPGELSTYEDTFRTAIGEKWYDANGVIGGQFLGTAKRWNVADLTSPTWGVGIRTSDNGDVYYTVGPPFLPLIIPPPQFLSLDPEWKKYCTGYLSNSPGLVSFALLDPPEILTPVAALPPAEALADEPAPPAVPPRTTPAAQLAKPTSPSIPKTTLVVVPSRPVSQLADSEPSRVPDESSRDKTVRPNSPNPQQSNGPETDGDPQRDDKIQPNEGLQQDLGPLQNEKPKQEDGSRQDGGSRQDNKSQQEGSSQQEDGIRSEFQQGDDSTEGSVDGSGFGGNVTPQPVEETDSQQKSDSLQEDDGDESSFQPANGVGSDRASQQVGGSLQDQGGSEIPLEEKISQDTGITKSQQGDGSLGKLILSAIDGDGQGLSSVASPDINSNTAEGATVILSNGVLSLVTPAPAVNVVTSNDRNPPPPKAAGSRILTVAGQTISANPAATPLIAADIPAGGEGILISGTPIRLSPSDPLFVAGSPVPLKGGSVPQLKSIFTVEDQVFTANPTGFILAGSNVVPGGEPVTISSTPISLGPSGTLFVGGNPIPLSNPQDVSSLPPNSVFVVGGEAFRANPIGFTVAGSKVLPGSTAVTVSGTPISLDSSGTLFLGNTAVPLRPTPFNPPSSVFTVGGEAFVPAPTGFAIAGATILPGGAPSIISGTRVSLNPSGELVLGTSTINLKAQSPTKTFTVGGLAFTAAPTGFTIAGSIVSPGSAPITISGTRISLDRYGQVAIGSSTINLLPPTPAANVYTFGDLTFTVQSSSTVVIDGKTLVPDGPAITASGRELHLDRAGSLVIGSVSSPVETGSRQEGNITSKPFEPYLGGQGRAAVASTLSAVSGVLLGIGVGMLMRL